MNDMWSTTLNAKTNINVCLKAIYTSPFLSFISKNKGGMIIPGGVKGKRLNLIILWKMAKVRGLHSLTQLHCKKGCIYSVNLFTSGTHLEHPPTRTKGFNPGCSSVKFLHSFLWSESDYSRVILNILKPIVGFFSLKNIVIIFIHSQTIN